MTISLDFATSNHTMHPNYQQACSSAQQRLRDNDPLVADQINFLKLFIKESKAETLLEFYKNKLTPFSTYLNHTGRCRVGKAQRAHHFIPNQAF
jgi:hypothetical protein